MASGCILGDCYLCKMPVFEDEATFNDKTGKFKHSYCKTNKELQHENNHLKGKVEEYERWFNNQ